MPQTWLLLGLLWALAGPASGDEVPAQLQARIAAFCAQMPSPGLSISIGIEDQAIWSMGCGLADVEQTVDVDPANTLFRIGSVAKPYTAFALARLVESGRIDLDADVRDYVPAFPEKVHAFSVRQLAGHLAGIRHYRAGEIYLHQRFETVPDSLSIFADDPLLHVPGAAWRYSSYGYNLLSAVIEQVAGVPFTEYLQTEVFEPLGMRQTYFDHLDQIIPGRGRYYRLSNGELTNEREVDNSYKWASGGLISTTEDMVRFGRAYLTEDWLRQETIDEFWTPQKTTDGESTDYGLGWRIVRDGQGRLWIGHGGGSVGGTSQFWIFPDQRVVLAAASNLTELDYGLLLVDLRDLIEAGD